MKIRSTAHKPKPRIRWGLRAKIIAWAFVPTAIILIGVALVTLIAYQRVTEDLAIERNQDLGRLSANQLAGKLVKYSDLLGTLARTSDIYDADSMTQRSALKRTGNRLAIFNGGVLILDTRGTVVASEPMRPEVMGQDWSDLACYRELFGFETLGPSTATYSDIVAAGPGETEVVCIAVPITGERSEFLGAILGMFRLGATATSSLYGDIVRLRIGASGGTYLLDGTGRVIYHSNTDYIGADFSNQEVVQRVLKGETGAVRTRDLYSQDVVASFSPVPGTSWGLVTQERWATLISAGKNYQRSLLLLMALGVLMPALVVAIGVRRITRPITKLINAAQEVASGNFGQTMTEPTGDEIEELAEQFNLMSAQLRESYTHLERRVADRTKELAALNAISAVASQSLDIDAVLNDALETALQVMEIEAGGIYLLDEDTGLLCIVVQRGFSPEFVRAVNKLKVGEGFSGRVAQSGQPLVIKDVSDDPRLTRMIVREEGLHSLAIAPLSSKGKVLGTLFASTFGYHEFTDQDVQLLTSIGHQIGVAIENARLFEAEQRRAEQFRVISEVGGRITSILEVKELQVQIARLMKETFNYYAVCIGLIDGAELVFWGGSGAYWDGAPMDQTLRIKVGEQGLTGWVAATGDPLLVPDVSQDPRYYVIPETSETRSEIAVPLQIKGIVIGVLDVQSDQLNAFDESDLVMVQALASQAAVAIENAHLFEAEQRRAEQFRVISEVGSRITSILNIDELLKQITHLVKETFNFYAVGVALVEGNEAVFRAGAGAFWEDAQLFRTLRLKVGQEGFTGWVAATGKPLLVPDVSKDPRYYLVPEASETRSEIAVPLKIMGTVIGVLGAQSDRLQGFDESDLVMLQSLASQAAVAIQNARLFKSEQRRAEQFRVISEVGRRITSILHIDEVLVQVVRLIQKAFDYDHVAIALIEEDYAVYKHGAGILWDDPEFDFRPRRLKVGEEGFTGWVAGTGRPLLVPDVSQDPRYVWMQGSPTRSELTVPIKARGKVLGVLDVQSQQLDAFDETDLTVLQSLAHQAGVALENAILFEAEQRRAEQFRLITEVGSRVASILSVDELLDQVVRLIQGAFNYYLVEVGLVEGDEVIYRARAKRDDDSPFESFRLKIGHESVTGWVAGTGDPYLVPDVSREPRYVRITDTETRSELTVPIKIQDKVTGVINVESDRLNGFDVSDLVVLQSLANQTAIAIENARHYEQAQQLAVLEERNRLARDLHDAVTQTLFSASLIAEALPVVWDVDRDEGAQLLQELQQLSRGALAEMRTLLLELRPAALIETSLGDLLRQLATAVTGRSGLPVDVTTERPLAVPPDVHVALYRIAQEALNNIVKHAHAKQVTVSLRRTSIILTGEEEPRMAMELRVSDDGHGFNPQHVPTNRLGLGIIHERAQSVGATLTIESAPDHGTNVIVIWPLYP